MILILQRDLSLILQLLLVLYLVLVLELVFQWRDVSVLPLHNQVREIFNIMLTCYTICTLRMRTLPLVVPKYSTGVTLDLISTFSEASSSSPKSSLKSSGLLILQLG